MTATAAMFAAHLLAALGIEWRLEASYWKEHAWVVARVNGVDYDLLDLRKNASETNRASYKLLGHFFVRASHAPPMFAWRRAWAQRTGRDLHTGLELGLLAVDSKPGAEIQRIATDWTQKCPTGTLSPVDDRALTATIAGFPYGEPLHVEAIASVKTSTQPAASGALARPTSSANTSAR